MVTTFAHDTKKRKFSELPRMSGTRRRGTVRRHTKVTP